MLVFVILFVYHRVASSCVPFPWQLRISDDVNSWHVSDSRVDSTDSRETHGWRLEGKCLNMSEKLHLICQKNTRLTSSWNVFCLSSKLFVSRWIKSLNKADYFPWKLWKPVKTKVWGLQNGWWMQKCGGMVAHCLGAGAEMKWRDWYEDKEALFGKAEKTECAGRQKGWMDSMWSHRLY